MAKDMFYTTTTFAVILLVLALAFWPSTKGHVVTYDCNLADTSKDYPVEVKEQCKQLRSKQ